MICSIIISCPGGKSNSYELLVVSDAFSFLQCIVWTGEWEVTALKRSLAITALEVQKPLLR